MASIQSRTQLQIRQKCRGRMVGPINMLSPKEGSTVPEPLYMYSFSQVIACEWHSSEEEWTRANLNIERAGEIVFKAGSVRFLQIHAWPCSMSIHDGEEEVGWAIDEWEALMVPDAGGESVTVSIGMAVMGVGTRFNRVGYMWTAYATERHI